MYIYACIKGLKSPGPLLQRTAEDKLPLWRRRPKKSVFNARWVGATNDSAGGASAAIPVLTRDMVAQRKSGVGDHRGCPRHTSLGIYAGSPAHLPVGCGFRNSHLSACLPACLSSTLDSPELPLSWLLQLILNF